MKQYLYDYYVKPMLYPDSYRQHILGSYFFYAF